MVIRRIDLPSGCSALKDLLIVKVTAKVIAKGNVLVIDVSSHNRKCLFLTSVSNYSLEWCFVCINRVKCTPEYKVQVVSIPLSFHSELRRTNLDDFFYTEDSDSLTRDVVF